MANETQNGGTASETPEAQPSPEQNPAPEAGTPVTHDEVTTLRSRNAGLDAKVTELIRQLNEEKAARLAAETKVNEYAQGKAVEDEDTRALLQRLNAELEASKQAARTAELRAKYPETFNVLGDSISALSEEALAASEARFLGVPAESNTPPAPVGNNAARTPAPASKPVEEMSLAELKEYGKSQFATLTWEDITQE